MITATDQNTAQTALILGILMTVTVFTYAATPNCSRSAVELGSISTSILACVTGQILITVSHHALCTLENQELRSRRVNTLHDLCSILHTIKMYTINAQYGYSSHYRHY